MLKSICRSCFTEFSPYHPTVENLDRRFIFIRLQPRPRVFRSVNVLYWTLAEDAPCLGGVDRAIGFFFCPRKFEPQSTKLILLNYREAC